VLETDPLYLKFYDSSNIELASASLVFTPTAGTVTAFSMTPETPNVLQETNVDFSITFAHDLPENA
jgi:hypothetical protein